MLRFTLLSLALSAMTVAGCRDRDRDQQLAQCVDIYRSMYVAGQVRDCLVQRYGWSTEDAAKAERERLGRVHPDSAAQSDSGRVGSP
jgi:hypothetical protein